MYNPDIPGPSDGVLLRLLWNCFLFFCSNLAVFIFLTLLANIQETIDSRHKVPLQWEEFVIIQKDKTNNFVRMQLLSLIEFKHFQPIKLILQLFMKKV